MKRILTILATLMLSFYANAEEVVYYRIRLDQDIDKAAQRLVVKGLEKADTIVNNLFCIGIKR